MVGVLVTTPLGWKATLLSSSLPHTTAQSCSSTKLSWIWRCPLVVIRESSFFLFEHLFLALPYLPCAAFFPSKDPISVLIWTSTPALHLPLLPFLFFKTSFSNSGSVSGCSLTVLSSHPSSHQQPGTHFGPGAKKSYMSLVPPKGWSGSSPSLDEGLTFESLTLNICPTCPWDFPTSELFSGPAFGQISWSLDYDLCTHMLVTGPPLFLSLFQSGISLQAFSRLAHSFTL